MSDRSDWHRPNDEMSGEATSCPKCALEFSTMLFQFCQHKSCPVRDFETKRRYHEKGDDMAAQAEDGEGHNVEVRGGGA